VDWTNLNVFIVATLMTIVTVLVGGIAVISGWMESGPVGNALARRLSPLYMFTIGVALNLLALPVLWLVPDNWKSITWIVFLIVASGLFVAGAVLEFSGPRKPGRRLLRIGSVIVLFANVIGIACMALCLL
jgi:hypothetical protein